MTVAEKIKKIRTFRGMTQKDLAALLDMGPKGDNRLAQYETGYRVPKKELLDKIAEALNVNPLCLYDVSGENASEIMELFFWLEEANPGAIQLFQTMKFPDEKANASDDTAVYYHDNDRWPAHPPVGMWFKYGVLNDFMKEWLFRKEELRSGTITREEYFEWKIGWPETCDECGRFESRKGWRKEI